MSIYLQGLKGLSAESRQKWEKDNLDLISGYSNTQKNQVYLNQQFRKTFGHRPDYNALKSLSSDDRNRMLERYQRDQDLKKSFLNNTQALSQIGLNSYFDLLAMPEEQRDLIQDRWNDYTFDEDFKKRYQGDPSLDYIMSVLDTDSRRSLLREGWKSAKDLKNLRKSYDSKIKKAEKWEKEHPFQAAMYSSTKARTGNGKSYAEDIKDDYNSQYEDAIKTNNKLLEDIKNEDVSRKLNAPETQELVSQFINNLNNLAQQPDGMKQILTAIDQAWGTSGAGQGSSYYKAFKNKEGFNWENVGINTLSGAALGTTVGTSTKDLRATAIGAGIGAVAGFLSGILGEKYGNKPSIEGMSDSEKIEKFAQFLALNELYGQYIANQNTEESLKSYLTNQQNFGDKQENTVRNIGVGGLTNIASKYFFFRNGYKALTNQGPYYLQGLEAVTDEKGNFVRDANGNVITRELPWYDNPKFFSDAEQANTFDINTINTYREAGGLSKYQNLYKSEWSAGAMVDNAVKMLKFAWSDALVSRGIGAMTEGVSALSGAQYVNRAGQAVSAFNKEAQMVSAGAKTQLFNSAMQKFINPALSATGISESYGMQTFEQTYSELNQKIDTRKDALAKEYASSRADKYLSSKGAAEAIEKKTQELIEEYKASHPGENQSIIIDPFRDMATQMYVNAMAAMDAESDLQGDREKASQASMHAYVADAVLEEGFMWLANYYTPRKMLLDKGSRKALGLTGSELHIKSIGDMFKVIGNPTKLTKVAGWSTLGGFESNFHDDARVDFGKGFGFSSFNDMASMAYKGDQVISNNMGFFGNMLDGMKYMADHYFDAQHFYDGLIGAAGGIFNVQVNPNVFSKQGRGQSFRTDALGNRLSISESINKYLYNPILAEYQETKQADDAVRQRAAALNTVMEKKGSTFTQANTLLYNLKSMDADPDDNRGLIDRLDIKAMLAIAAVNGVNDLIEGNDLLMYQMGIADSEAGNLISQTEKYRQLQQQLQLLTSGQELTQEQAEPLIQAYLAEAGNRTEAEAYLKMSDAEKSAYNEKIINKLRDNAKFMTETVNTFNEAMEKVNDVVGDSNISQDAKIQMAFSMAMQSNWENRRNEIEQDITGKEVNTEQVLNADFGTKKGYTFVKQGVEDKLQELQETKKELEQKLEDLVAKHKQLVDDNSSAQEIKENAEKLSAAQLHLESVQSQIRTGEEELEKLNNISEEELSNLNKKVLSKEEIMALNPIQRAQMLNPANRFRYSARQQKIIDSIVQDLSNNDVETLQKIIDSSALQSRIEQAEETNRLMLSHPQEVDQYVQAVRRNEFNSLGNAIRKYNVSIAEQEIRNAIKFYQEKNIPKTTEDIVKEIMAQYHPQIISDYIKKHPQYEALLQEVQKAATLKTDIKNIINSKFANPTQRQALNTTLSNLLQHHSSSEDIINTLEDLVDNSPDDVNKEAFDTILKGLEELNYSRNATKVQERQNKQKNPPQLQIVDAEEEAAAAVVFNPANTLISDEDKEINPNDVVLEEDMGTIIEGTQEKKAKRYSATPGVTISRDTANSQLEGGYTERASDDYVNKREQERINATIDYLNGDIANAKDYLIELGYAHSTENAWLDSATSEEIQQKADKKVNMYKPFITDNEAESKVQQPATPEGMTPIPTEEMMTDAILEDINFDEETGQAVTPTVVLDPNKNNQVITCVDNDYTNEPVLPVESSSAPTLPGNFFKGWEYNALEQDGKQVEATSQAKSKQAQMQDAVFRQWLKDNNIHLQDIIDEELGYIIQQFPDTQIRFMLTKPKSMNKWEDMMIENQILVIEYSDKIKKSGIHNDKNGGIISANGKEWLVVGSLGFEGSNPVSIKAKNTTINSDMLRRRMEYFNASPSENYYVDTVAHTQVSKMTNGRLTLQLANQDSIEVKPITELIGDGKPSATNPDGVTLESLAWGIQTNDSFKPIGLMPGEELNVLPPVKVSDNVGRVFVLIPSSDGKHYIPANIRPTMWGELKEGDLKQSITDILMEVSAPNLATRQSGIKKLCKIFHMPNEGGPTILVGSQRFPNSLTVIGQGGTILAQFVVDQNFNRLDFLRAVEQANFRININESVLSTPSEIRRYAEAGALNTDLAKLRPSGAIFNVYSCDRNGKPLIGEAVHYNSSIPGSDLQRAQRFEYSTMLVGKTYRYRDGKFQDEQGREVTDASILDNLYYNKQLDDSKIPVASIIISGGKSIEQYILNDTNDPLVYNKDTKTKEITVLQGDEALKVISEIKNRAEAKERAKQASNIVELEDVIIGDNPVDNVVITNDQAPIPEDMESGTPPPAPTPAPTITTEQMQQQMLGDFTTEAPPAPAPIQAPVPVPVPSNENIVKETQNINEVGNNSLINLGNQEKSGIFAEVMVQNKGVRKRLKEVFTRKGLPFGTPAEVEKVLQSMGVPVSGITDVEKWISNIENCK